MHAIDIQLDQCGQLDRLTGAEAPGRQRFVSFDGVEDFPGLPGLTASEVSRFESAGVVFAFRLAAFVRGLLMRRACRLFQSGEALGQAANNLLYQCAFIHFRAMYITGMLNQSFEEERADWRTSTAVSGAGAPAL